MENLNPNHSTENDTEWEIPRIDNEKPRMFDMTRTYEDGEFLGILQPLLGSLYARNNPEDLEVVIPCLEYWELKVMHLRTENPHPDIKILVGFYLDPDGVIRLTTSVRFPYTSNQPEN